MILTHYLQMLYNNAKYCMEAKIVCLLTSPYFRPIQKGLSCYNACLTSVSYFYSKFIRNDQKVMWMCGSISRVFRSRRRQMQFYLWMFCLRNLLENLWKSTNSVYSHINTEKEESILTFLLLCCQLKLGKRY